MSLFSSPTRTEQQISSMGGEATKGKIRRAIVIIYILMLSVASVSVAGLCAAPRSTHCFAQTHCVKPQGSCGVSGEKKGRVWTGGCGNSWLVEKRGNKREKRRETERSSISCLLTGVFQGVS